MNPYTTITARDLAAKIKNAARDTVSFNLSQLKTMHNTLHTPGMEQAVLDQLENPTQELAHYGALKLAMEIITSPATATEKHRLMGAIQQAVSTLNFPLGVAGPTQTGSFVPQPDGSIRYLAPESEAAPEPLS